MLALALSLCALPCTAAEPPVRSEGEKQVADAEHPPLYINVDTTLFNIGISAAGHLRSGFYVGGGLSFLPAVTFNSFKAYPIEYAEVHGFVRYEPVSALQMDVGVRLAQFEELKICIFGGCGPAPSGTLLGPYADLRLGWRHFKVGPRGALAVRVDTGETGALLYPLFVSFQMTP